MSDSDTPFSMSSSASSTRPYLVRAMYEWCADNGFTPYIAAYVDASVQVPLEFVKNNEIVLNVGMDATSDLLMDNEWISFKARFSGTAREILVPMERVMAIYARENGQGMTFPVSPNTPVAVKPSAAQPVNAIASQATVALHNADSKVVQLIKPKTAKLAIAKQAEATLEEVLPQGTAEMTPNHLADAHTGDEPPKSPTPSRGGLKRVK